MSEKANIVVRDTTAKAATEEASNPAGAKRAAAWLSITAEAQLNAWRNSEGSPPATISR